MSIRNYPLIVLILLVTVGVPQSKQEKRPFSVPALQGLLDRKEYDRFDYFIGNYLQQHPDTAVLFLLKSERFFSEALERPSRKVVTEVTVDPTGGIPRKYASYIEPARTLINKRYVRYYDDSLLQKAFIAVDKALSLIPDSNEIHEKKCRMAARAKRPDILAGCVAEYINRFGCDAGITELVYDFLGSSETESFDTSQVILLQKVMNPCPAAPEVEKENLQGEIAAWYLSRGKIDSAYSIICAAVNTDSSDTSLLSAAYKIACVKSDFGRAGEFALKRHAQTGRLFDLELAALATMACDTIQARQMFDRIKKSEEFNKNTSLCSHYYSSEKKSVTPRFFSGEFIYLNFPVLEFHYKKSGDIINHHFNKAGLFYALSLYDSAGYYNLNLMRRIKTGHALSFNTLYNLAAEHYASGRYRLSHQRFLELYRYYHEKRDASVHYALAVTSEAIGDSGNARYHYKYVIRHARHDNKEDRLVRKNAQYRLAAMKSKSTLSENTGPTE
ncbi:MAG: hypothetical protein GF401_02585 [Chitinivibrionales bacterium]|nr:hypothetical protein [Chitinivibrionales bacterium]